VVLARELKQYGGRLDAIVLALPRGGVPVAYEVAKALRLPLDVFVVRKLGVPGFEELALGAVASGGTYVLNEEVLAHLPDADTIIRRVLERERIELQRREQEYRSGRPFPDLTGRVVILVDDGLATGASMRAAIRAVREAGAGQCVVAVPAASPETCDELRAEVDEIFCAVTSDSFRGVGQFYEDFSQTSDDEVRRLLERSTTTNASV
jgi:predicted phosphoribosyltransferase